MDLRRWAAYILATAAALSGIAPFAEVDGASFTFQNSCKHTVWPGILANGGSPLLADGGFELGVGQAMTIDVPVGWSGRFWGRTGCSFAASASPSAVACQTGDCGGKLQCSGAGAAPPATLAEITLAGTQPSVKQDFYDVSLVDGYNLPVAIAPTSFNSTSSSATASSGQLASAASSPDSYLCQAAGCTTDLNLNCPSELQVRVVTSASGVSSNAGVVACKSACEAFQSPQYCCSGSYANPNTCQPSSYSKLFKQACPRAYSYAFDDPTSTFTCTGADYAIVFCPSSLSLSSPKGVANANDGHRSGAKFIISYWKSLLVLAVLNII